MSQGKNNNFLTLGIELPRDGKTRISFHTHTRRKKNFMKSSVFVIYGKEKCPQNTV